MKESEIHITLNPSQKNQKIIFVTYQMTVLHFFNWQFWVKYTGYY